jgi:hypothetical protein
MGGVLTPASTEEFEMFEVALVGKSSAVIQGHGLTTTDAGDCELMFWTSA